MIQQLEEAIAREFSAEENVRYVLLETSDGCQQVLAVLDEAGPAVRRRIYRIEERLMNQFPDKMLDFNILRLRGAKPCQISTDALVVFDRERYLEDAVHHRTH